MEPTVYLRRMEMIQIIQAITAGDPISYVLVNLMGMGAQFIFQQR